MKSDTLAALALGGLFMLALFGWVNNIILIAQADVINGFFVLRCLGVLVAPLGAILGWV